MTRHLKILEYALSSLLRRRHKNLAILCVYTLTVSILASVLFLTHALKREASELLSFAPDLIIQRTVAGRHDFTPPEYGPAIEAIPGVGEVRPRYWGYYYDALTGSNFTVIGVEDDPGSLDLLKGRMPASPGECAVGAGVSKIRRAGLGGDLILIDSEGMGTVFEVVGVFRSSSSLLTNDLIVFRNEDVIDFFGLSEKGATDLSVQVFNRNEVQNVARKIKRLFPDTRPITREEISRTYEAVFNWRSGMMLTIFASSLIAFSILAWDKATGISGEEKREIGILKAVGWDAADILELKFWEGMAVSVTAFLLGAIAAFVHVFLLGAPLLARIMKGWSVLFPDFRLTPHFDLYQIFVIAFLTIVPYVASTIVPSWKAAVTDPETIMRS
jgi:ABC-type antimicrobial peptide transport system permease subunit